MIKSLIRIGHVCIIAAKQFFNERYTYRASALSFTSILAIVPSISVVVSITSIFPIFTRLVTVAQDYVFANFIPTSGNVIQSYIEGFVQKARGLPAIGLIFLIITVALLLTTIAHTLNEVWNAPKKRRKSLWVLYYAVLLSAPVVIGLSLVISSYLFSRTWLSIAPSNFQIEIYFFGLLSLAINTAIFAVIYIIIPNCKVPYRDGLLGGLIAALLFEVIKRIFAFYILHFHSYELIYGVMSTIPIFLIWVYISWMIILYGALISHANYQYRQKHRK